VQYGRWHLGGQWPLRTHRTVDSDQEHGLQ
jgi:hypothetical protein